MTQSVSHETPCLPLNIQAQIDQRRAGRRQKVHHHGLVCSKCLERSPRSKTDRYCDECRAAASKNQRKKNREELKRLKELEQKLGTSKGDDNEQCGPAAPRAADDNEPGRSS